MSKEKNVKVNENEKKETGNFIDKTEQNWFNKKGTNTIVFCNSLDEFIDGKVETIEYTNKDVSLRIQTKGEKEIEKTNFVLFTISEGKKYLVKSCNKLK